MTTYTQTQFIRFAIIGTISNGLLYLFYIGLTSAGVGHKLAMSILYSVGVLQTFLFNKTWTFQHNIKNRRAFARYCLIYGIGFVLNLMALMVLVDWVGLQHQAVQGVMILITAVFLFLLQKCWVFGSAIQKIHQ